MEHGHVFLDVVAVSDRLRRLDAAKVESIAASMDLIGLQQPVSIWASEDGSVVDLVAGAHRIAAAKKLGWEKIDCIFVDLDDLDRQLWEIDENLCRADLSPAELAQHLKRRAELWKERKNTGPTCPTNAGKGQPKGFAKDTEDKTGTPKRTTNRALARAKAIPPEIMALVQGTDLDTGTYLDKLKNLSDEEQRAKVDADLEVIEQRKNDARLKEQEKRRKEEAKEQRRRDFAEMGELLDSNLTAKECEWFLNVLAKYAGKTANDLRAWSNT